MRQILKSILSLTPVKTLQHIIKLIINSQKNTARRNLVIYKQKNVNLIAEFITARYLETLVRKASVYYFVVVTTTLVRV